MWSRQWHHQHCHPGWLHHQRRQFQCEYYLPQRWRDEQQRRQPGPVQSHLHGQLGDLERRGNGQHCQQQPNADERHFQRELGRLWRRDEQQPSSPALTNVTFADNSATNNGGGLYNTNTSYPTLKNVTFSGNSANIGGAIGNYYSNPTMDNTILWGNTATTGAQIFNDNSTPVVSDSVVQGGYAGTNIITADPLLDALGDHGGATPTIPLLSGSSAIDTGNDLSCAASDQRGILRPQGAHCDIGAYEVQIVLLAAPGGQTSGACNSWANACELGYALTSAVSGQELWVAAGRYTPTSGTNRSLSFNLKTGVALYGGFAGTETARDHRDPASNVTTLSGDLNGDDVGFTNNGENSYHVLSNSSVDSTAILDGFTISGGNANGTSPSNSAAGCITSPAARA